MVIVGVGIAAGLVILFITGCTIWCCCCRGRKARAKKMKKQEDEYQAQRDAISDKHEAGLVWSFYVFNRTQSIVLYLQGSVIMI